jgi:peptidoglycan/LPS O-acetylase OafA/YrhL
MLLAAVIGYAGCETMAISNLVSGRRDEVGCVLFSAFDFIEGKGCHAKQSLWSSGLLASIGIMGCASFPLIAFLIEARGRENWLKYLPIVVVVVVVLMVLIAVQQYRFRKQT